MLNKVISSREFISVLFLRLLGMMDLNLREVVSKGKQSVSSPLKSKEGQLMQVGCHDNDVLSFIPSCLYISK